MPKHVLDNVSEHMKMLKDHVTKQIHEKDQKIKELLRSLAEKDQKIEELQERVDAQQKAVERQVEGMRTAVHQSQTNVFQWRIDEWERKIEYSKNDKDRRQLKSGIFTLAYGYQGYLSLYPNGCDKSDKGHISLFVHVRKGIHDDSLQWPFPFPCDISLVNETDETKSVIFPLPKCNDKGYRKCWDQPTEDNLGIGCPRLASHDELADSSLTKNNYLLVRLCVNKV